MSIHIVILAGGWGRRFWPQSRRRFPKQLLCLGKRYSLIRNLFNIIKSEVPKERIWVVANKAYAQNLRRQMPALPKKNLLIEPFAKNTAAAIGWAAVVIKRVDPEAITVVLSSDQIYGKTKRLVQAIRAACMQAEKCDCLVAVGMSAQRPAEEFGYLKITQNSKRKSQSEKIYKVEKFVEKPNLTKAKMYLKSKNYLWNAGIFAWKATAILQAIKQHLPQLHSGLQRIARARNSGPGRYKSQLVKEYKRFKDISIDYGILERARNIYTVVGDFLWQDLGSWNNLAQGRLAKDRQGNVIQGLHRGIDTCNSVIFGQKQHLIATLGVRDLVIVQTPLATLVCKKDKAQQVKQLTRTLEKDKHLKKYL